MSDGSENIYFLDTEFIQETHRIQVYDNKGAVKMLNELEYIDGLIYANVYGSDYIVAFEEKTGKVVKHIDLTGILKKQDIKSRIDVLNGIAWDKNNKRIVVTGKLWPYFYEIMIIHK
jgi:glutamine cyclotransferase